MAEVIKPKSRSIGIDLAPVITSKNAIATTVWKEQPRTLRADALTISPGDVTEDEIYSHENDIAEDYDAIGTGRNASGSFIGMSADQLKDLVGGAVEGTGDAAMFLKTGKINILNTAIRFRLKDGSAIILPNARGYVDIDLNLGATDGRFKCPFKLQSLAQADFDCDLIWVKKYSTGGGE